MSEAAGTSSQAAEPEFLTEVPGTLKKLIRYIIRGFYDLDHSLVIDYLITLPCIKEEYLLELLKFDRKQLRTVINTLKNDKFIKSRIRMETDADKKTTKHNYYFINYSTFVNVVKYKLDHMRRKIESEERDSTSRASFKCPNCTKTYTDLEAGLLFDPSTGEMHCTYCQTEVEEEASGVPKKDARTLMVKFNEQIEPIYNLLKEVEDVKLAPELLEPEPMDIKSSRAGGGGGSRGNDSSWSGDRNRRGFNFTDNQVTISMDEHGGQVAAKAEKERPVWMTDSTVEGSNSESSSRVVSSKPSATDDKPVHSKEQNTDIMKVLMMHEKKATNTPHVPGIPAPSDDDTSTSESETEMAPPKPGPSQMNFGVGFGAAAVTEEMESDDDEEEEPMVTIGDQRVLYDKVTEDIIAQMTDTERDTYIKMGQEMYSSMYD